MLAVGEFPLSLLNTVTRSPVLRSESEPTSVLLMTVWSPTVTVTTDTGVLISIVFPLIDLIVPRATQFPIC